MTPWTILLDAAPVLALALAIMCLPLLDDGPPRRRDHARKNRHVPRRENVSAKAHSKMATAEVHFAKVR
jgi:hypothetical protein